MTLQNTPQNGNQGKMKYKQLADHIMSLIEIDQLHIGDQLPSLKQLQLQLKMSKETLLKGLNELVEKGIVNLFTGKGITYAELLLIAPSVFFCCSIK